MISIPVTLITRQWMKAAKAWRCFLELPIGDDIIAAQLTAYIESRMNVTLQSEDGSVVIEPAFIVDVPNKGKKFTLVIETIMEVQASIGPYLTGMVGKQIIVKISATDAPPTLTTKESTEPHGDVDEKTIRGLHIQFFKNPKFWAFMTGKTSWPITDETECKEAFKMHMGVGSCKGLKQADFNALLQEFNEYMNQR